MNRLFFILALATLISFCNGKVVKETLQIYYFSGSPDGVYKTTILGVNGQIPGPTLEGEVGDTFEITVINSIQDGQGLTLHWHGINQEGSGFEDGTALVSQCPLPSGHSMIYKFNVTQPGTFWYHSHVGSQYTEGLYGAIIIREPTPAYEYDGELTLVLSDWSHQTAAENEEWHFSEEAFGAPPAPDSGLINGVGRYPCNYAELKNLTCSEDLQFRKVFRMEVDKTYRIRTINAAGVAYFNVSVDYHTVDFIEADGIDLAKPETAHFATIGPGQRYSFLFKCEQEERYLLRSDMWRENFVWLFHDNINLFPEAIIRETTAVIECVSDDLGHHKNKVEERVEVFNWREMTPPQGIDNHERIWLDEMKLSPMHGIQAPDYFDIEYKINASFWHDENNTRRATFNNTPMYLHNLKPLLMQVIEEEDVDKEVFPLEIENGQVVQLVLFNAAMGAHTFHLHGHHFWVMGMGGFFDGDYEVGNHTLSLNGVYRDTLRVESFSWAVIRFKADNPGVWLFHCHIDWHMLTGMGLTFIESKDILRRDKVTDEAMRVCKLHNNWVG